MSGRAKQTATPAAPVVVNLPSPSMPSGAQGTVLVLGAGLAGVALWSDTIAPLLDSAWNGTPLNISLPASGIASLVLFVGALVFVSDLSPDAAQVALWLVIALWCVWLVMHPGLVSTVTSWLSQGAQTAGAAIPASQQPGAAPATPQASGQRQQFSNQQA